MFSKTELSILAARTPFWSVLGYPQNPHGLSYHLPVFPIQIDILGYRLLFKKGISVLNHLT